MKKLITLVACLAFLLVAMPVMAGKSSNSGKASEKVDVCHVDEYGVFHKINISENAKDKHLEHGDAEIGSQYPDMPGYAYDADCSSEFVGFVCQITDFADVGPDTNPWTLVVGQRLTNILSNLEENHFPYSDVNDINWVFPPGSGILTGQTWGSLGTIFGLDITDADCGGFVLDSSI